MSRSVFCRCVAVAMAAILQGCGRNPEPAAPYVDARASRAVVMGSLSDGRAAAGAWVGIAIEGAAGPAGNVVDAAAYVEGEFQPRLVWTLTHRSLQVENRDHGLRNFHMAPFDFPGIAAFAPREQNLAMHEGAPVSVQELAGGVYALRQEVTPSNDRAGTMVVLPSVPWLTRADAQGRFRFDDLPPGRATLVVVAPDGRAAACEFEIKGGTQAVPPMGLIVPR